MEKKINKVVLDIFEKNKNNKKSIFSKKEIFNSENKPSNEEFIKWFIEENKNKLIK